MDFVAQQIDLSKKARCKKKDYMDCYINKAGSKVCPVLNRW